MAVVILVMGILFGILGSVASNIAFLKSSRDEGVILRDALVFSSRSALKSNQTIYFEIHIDENKYRAYRFDRTGSKPKEEELLAPRSLSASNSIVGIAVSTGARITSGKVTIPFSPSGMGEEVAIYIGPKPQISATVIYSRYGGDAKVEQGEAEHNLENPAWKENVEDL